MAARFSHARFVLRRCSVQLRGGRVAGISAVGAGASPLSTSAAQVQASGATVSKTKDESLSDTIRNVLAAGKAAKKEKKGSGEGGSSSPDESPAKLDGVSLKRLLRLVRPEIPTLAGAVSTLAITTGISLLFPYVIGQVLDVAVVTSGTLPSPVPLPSLPVPGAEVGEVGGTAAVVGGKGSSIFSGWSISQLSTGLLALFAAQSGLIVARSALLTIAGERMSATIRKDLFTAILRQETAWFDKSRTGDIINRLSSDTTVLQKALTSNIAGGLRSAFMTVGGVSMLAYLSPSLAAVSLCLIPPVAVSGVLYGRYVAGQQKRLQEVLGQTLAVAEEAVSSHRTVRQFAGEQHEDGRFRAAVEDSYKLARRLGIVASYFDGGVHMAANVGLVAVLWYGGGLIADGSMTAGDLTAFLMYSLYTGFNLSNLSTTYTELKRASGAAARIFDIMDRQPAMPSTGASQPEPVGAEGGQRGQGAHGSDASSNVTRPALTLPALQGLVSFDRVHFSYPTRPHVPVLQDFSLVLQPGTVTALVGGSGSGKSTVGLLLTRLYDPGYSHGPAQAGSAGVDVASLEPQARAGYPGVVTLDGVDIRSLDPAWLRGSAVGVVSQEPTLFACSIADNIRYGARGASDEQVMEAARAANADDFIRAFPAGYSTHVGERGVQLSGGQKQRVAIARALLKQPKVLVLDEATSALDSESEAAVTAALVRAAHGRTVLTIAHRLSTMRTAQSVAVLQGGKIVEQGSFDALAAQQDGVFRQLVDKQLLQ